MMPKFLIKDKIPCYVTWTYEIDAANEDAARDQFVKHQSGQVGEPEIGDPIESGEQTVTILSAS